MQKNPRNWKFTDLLPATTTGSGKEEPDGERQKLRLTRAGCLRGGSAAAQSLRGLNALRCPAARRERASSQRQLQGMRLQGDLPPLRRRGSKSSFARGVM